MFVLLNRIQLMEGRKTSQQTLVEHISAETFPTVKSCVTVGSSVCA